METEIKKCWNGILYALTNKIIFKNVVCIPSKTRKPQKKNFNEENYLIFLSIDL